MADGGAPANASTRTHTDDPSLDDLGRPLPRVPSGVYQNLGEGDALVRHRRSRRWQWVVLGAVIVTILALAWAVNGPSELLFVAEGILGISVLGTVIVVLLDRLWRRAFGRRRGVRMTSCMVARGTCGCCGYSLASLRTAEGGAVPCPECGAAWHSQRWSDGRLDQIDIHRAANLKGRSMDRSGYLACDDRGVLLDHQFRMPAIGVLGGPGAVAVVARAMTAARRRLRMIVAGVLALAVVCLGLLIATLNVGDDVYAQTLWILAVVGGVLILGVVSQLDVHGAVTRSVILRTGHCPQCVSPLDRERREFDGLIGCPGCGRAWRADDVGWPSGAS